MLKGMNGRDRDDGVGTGILKLGLGMGVGFAIYMLVGGTGGFGFGRNAGAGTGPGPAAPPRPRDTQPVEILVKPSPADPKKAVIETEGKIVTVDDLVARIAAGGRRDVLVKVRGDTIQGGWDDIHAALTSAGIQVSIWQTPIGPTVPTGTAARNR